MDNTLLSVVHAVFVDDESKLIGQKEIIYRQVEQLVYSGLTDRLRSELETLISEYVFSQKQDSEFVLDSFKKYENSLFLLTKLFNALDRELIFKYGGGGLIELGQNIFHSWILEHEDHIQFLIKRLLLLIKGYRENGGDNEIFEIFHLTLKVNLFKKKFESNFIISSVEWYKEKSSSASSSSLEEYISITENVFDMEKKLTNQLPLETWKFINQNITESFIKDHLPNLITRDLHVSILKKDLNFLKKLFQLANLIDDDIIVDSVLKHEWTQSVQKWISHCLVDHRSLIEKLLLVKKNLLEILTISFDNRKSFGTALKDSIETVLNSTRVPVPLLLSEYLDTKFHHFIDTSDSIHFDEEIGLFKHIASKDVFEVHFRNFLAGRLIYTNFSKLTDIVLPKEQEFINLLKQECGPGYTNKCECMIKDAYAEIKIPFGACIITSGVWPRTIVGNDYSGSLLPKNIRNWELKFMNDYKAKFPKKTIKFNYGLSQGVVGYNKRDWICSFTQICILMFFDSVDSMSLDVIVRELGFSESEISKALAPIYAAEILVLHGNIVSLNPALGRSTQITRLNKYQFIHESSDGMHVRMSEEERAAAETTVMEDRQHQLDASIIRVMKQNKRCSVQYLIEQVQTPIFSTSEINRRIASLVDREFMQKEADELVYMA